MRPIIEYQGPLFQWLSAVDVRIGPQNVLIIWRAGVVAWLVLLSVLAWSGRFSRRFTGLLLAGIGLLRLPGLGLEEQNVDESQWIVSAATLVHDPRFWLSVDGTTSGPLNVWPPALLYYLGLSLDYATLRLWGLLTCILPTAWLLLATYRRHMGEQAARFAILPVAACLALTTDADAIAFNSEQLPMTLLALAGYLMSQIFADGPAKRTSAVGWAFMLGLVLGCLPFTKLQATPIGLVLAAWALAGLFRDSSAAGHRWLRVSWLVAGGLLPTLLVGVYLVSAGLMEYAFRSYLLTNLEYATVGSWGIGVVGVMGRLRIRLPQIYGTMPTTRWFWWLAVGMLGVGIGILFRPKDRTGQSITRWFAVSVCLVSIYATLQPGNPFAHYQWLSFVPASWLIGSTINYFVADVKGIVEVASTLIRRKINGVIASRLSGGLYLAVCIVLPGWLALSQPNPGIRQFAGTHYSWSLPITQAIRHYAHPNEAMVVWGWANNLHVETELLLGSRFIPLYFQVVPGAQQSYFLDLYRQDLLTNRPKIIVDAVGLHAGRIYNQYPIRRYPAIQAILDERYRLRQTVYGAKIYVRQN